MPGPLQQSQIEGFRQNGFLVCDEFPLDQSPAEIGRMVDEVADWPAEDGRWQHYREKTADGPVLARTERFLDFHAGLRQLLCDGSLTAAVAQLFGEPAVVFKEKINYKLPGGGGFAPHQDAQAYPLGSAHITCLVAIDENSIENGCLWFSPGAHRSGLLTTDAAGCLAASVVDTLPWEAAPLRPGGVTFFSSLVPHKSNQNTTDDSRRSLYVTYTRACEGDLRSRYYAERDAAMAQHDPATGQPPRISTIGHFQGEGV